jgi:hypothetical protein
MPVPLPPEAYSLNVTVIPIAGASPKGGFITTYPGIFGPTGPAPGTLPLDASLVWQGSTVYLSNSGSNRAAVGAAALYAANGDRNIALGFGSNLIAGSDNIMIGNGGMQNDDHTIRIGGVPDDQNVQASTYIAGILGNNLTNASPVVINSNGQLGVQPMVVSSRRYKEDIQDMGDASRGLLRLRPVIFHYKKPATDGSKPLEFGLIPEEVADVYPELVIRGADGQIESVQYEKVPAMLLNELQKQYRHAEEQDETIRKLEARLATLEVRLPTATSDKALPTPGR